MNFFSDIFSGIFENNIKFEFFFTYYVKKFKYLIIAFFLILSFFGARYVHYRVTYKKNIIVSAKQFNDYLNKKNNNFLQEDQFEFFDHLKTLILKKEYVQFHKNTKEKTVASFLFIINDIKTDQKNDYKNLLLNYNHNFYLLGVFAYNKNNKFKVITNDKIWLTYYLNGFKGNK